MMIVSSSFAQQLPILNHYIYNPYLYNPSRTGQDERGLVALHFKNQWTAMPNAPFTGALCLETPIKSEKLGNMGLGGMLYVDKMHLTTNIGGMGTYAYHIPFEKNKGYTHGLSAGISMGFLHQRINYPGAIVEDPNDTQLLPSESSGTSFDFSAGIDYEWKDLHVGVSMLQGLNTGLRLIDLGQDDIKYVNTRQWIIMTSYRHTFEPSSSKLTWYLEPVFMGRIIENVPFQAEGNIIVGLDKMGWLGIGYRSSNNLTATSAIEATLGVEIHEHFLFAYTFGIGVDANLNLNMGTQHEFMLAYSFGENKKIVKMQSDMIDLDEKHNQISDKVEDEAQKTKSKMDAMDEAIDEQKSNIEKTNDALNQQSNKIQQQNDQLKAHADHLDRQNEKLDEHSEEIEKLKNMMAVQPLKFKKIGEVFFDNASYALSESSKANMDAVYQALQEADKNGNKIKVYIKGNASAKGDAQKNMELSMKRATAVRQYLIGKGISGRDITIVPMGEEDPMEGTSDTETDDSRDRRVDVIFTQKKK